MMFFCCLWTVADWSGAQQPSFSLAATSLAAASDLQTPQDIQSRLLRTLGPTFLKRGWNFDVEIMGTVTRHQPTSC